MGKYKLYFSYNKLIAFETETDQYVTAKKHSFTTSNHRWGLRHEYKSKHYVDQAVLQVIALTEMMKQPFMEAKENADLYCKRIY